jgi:multimeric flavodoxin WrbA
MKITVIDGSLENYSKPGYTTTLAEELRKKGHVVNLLKANKMNINYCTGCWSCWWKTPGICPQKDDMEIYYKSYLSSDMVLHFSPLDMGFISSLLKTINDRSIPLIHPYITLVNGECHHKKRYSKYPTLGLIVDARNSDREDLEITKDLYTRFALNLKSKLQLFTTTHQTMEELTNAISNI